MWRIRPPARSGVPPRPPFGTTRRGRGPTGFTRIELLFTVAALTVLFGMAVPIGGDAIDELRTATAARYLASRITSTRIEAIKRSTPVGMRFQPVSADYSFRCYADGNGNGVR